MSLVLVDRVKVRSRFIGTDPIIIENTFPGFQNFDTVGDGNETYYGVFDNVGNWEIGRGMFDKTSQTLYRDDVVSSSNNNQKVVFPPGGKTVYSTLPSSVVNRIATNSLTDSFKYIAVDGQKSVVADSATDTLTLKTGPGIEISTNQQTDSITFRISPYISSSIIAEDSGVLVDTVRGKIVGPIDSDSVSCTSGILEISSPTGVSSVSPLIQLVGNTLKLTGSSSVEITTSQSHVWKFKPDGYLEFPDGTTQKTAFVSANQMIAEGNFNGDFYGNFIGSDSTILVNSETSKHVGIFVGSVETDDGVTLVDASKKEFYGKVVGEFNGIIHDSNGSIMLDTQVNKHYGLFEGSFTGSVFALSGTRAFDANSGKVTADLISNVVHPDGTILLNNQQKKITTSVTSVSGSTIVDTVTNTVSANAVSANRSFKLPVFSSVADRNLAVPAPERGMMVVVGDSVHVYTNTWVTI